MSGQYPVPERSLCRSVVEADPAEWQQQVESGHRTWQHPGMRVGIIAVISGLLLSACSSAEPRACKAPREHWRKPALSAGQYVHNIVSLTHDDIIYWNGFRVPDAELLKLLRASHKLSPEPDVHLQAEMGVSCEKLEQIRDRMEENLECQSGKGRCVEGYPNSIPPPTNGG